MELQHEIDKTLRRLDRLLEGDNKSNPQANQSTRFNTSRRQTSGLIRARSFRSEEPEEANSNGGGSASAATAGGTSNTTSNQSSAYNVSRSLSTRYPPGQNSRFMSTPLDARSKYSEKKHH